MEMPTSPFSLKTLKSEAVGARRAWPRLAFSFCCFQHVADLGIVIREEERAPAVVTVTLPSSGHEATTGSSTTSLSPGSIRVG